MSSECDKCGEHAVECRCLLPDKEFEKDLTNLLDSLEYLMMGRIEHVDYCKVYKRFIDRWKPSVR